MNTRLFRFKFPVTEDLGSFTEDVHARSFEEAQTEALDRYNRALAHDGNGPISELPQQTRCDCRIAVEEGIELLEANLGFLTSSIEAGGIKESLDTRRELQILESIIALLKQQTENYLPAPAGQATPTPRASAEPPAERA